MTKSKKEIEEELESLTNMMNVSAVRQQNMSLKLNDNERLLQHYEKTILVLLERIMELRVALSSLPPTESHRQAEQS
jgi:septal ring factor EnvC (AmiA/AmiB activator)